MTTAITIAQEKYLHTHYFSQGTVWGVNAEHTNDHIQSTKIVHSQQ